MGIWDKVKYVLSVMALVSCGLLCQLAVAAEPAALYLTETTWGSGLYEATDSHTLAAVWDDGPEVWRAQWAEGELVVIEVAAGLYQAVDEVALRADNVDEVIKEYAVDKMVAQDMRQVVKENRCSKAVIYLPAQGKAAYGCDDKRLAVTRLYVTTPELAPYETVAVDQQAREIFAIRKLAVYGMHQTLGEKERATQLGHISMGAGEPGE